MEPLDLPGRGRGPGLGQPVDDPVVPADPVEQHLPALAEPVGELLAIVGEHFAGHPVGAQRGSKRQADGPSGGPGRHRGDHAVPGMVIDPGHDLGLGPAGQERPADDVQLPQRHRLIAFPPQVAVLGPLPRPRLDQPVPDQDPVDAHPRRRRDHPGLGQLVRQPQRTPLRMLPAHLAHRRLHPRADLMRARLRAPGTIRQRAQAALLITAQPGMHALPRHSRPRGGLGHRDPGSDLKDSAIPLLDNGHLYQCQSRPPVTPTPANDEEQESRITGTRKPCGGTGMGGFKQSAQGLGESRGFSMS